ncbi:hypothetical protein OC846_002072 [Tilletia horrida]|uniref:Uncharacterized protein n=1 Tax=Tilletia horrida TaxID=155126 RepID=A0AAN6JT93_9BASI|nr:hypothetical protein OC846_002072 [Tilletia horrida]KAK0568094.1 hypothetical protein OC861_002259 [Tilletia horrida]
MKWLKRAFIENDIPEERNPFPGAVYDFDTPERQASLQPLNANGFIARCLLPELACCLIQVRDDCSFEEANRIRTESSAYGDAILPMLADKDEDDYLEFDLRRDVQKDDSPPSSSSLVPLPPAGTPKRRNLRGLSSQSSSPATRKEVPSSDGMPESSDSPLFTNTGRPLRAAAVEALDAVKAFERPKPRPRASIDSAPTEAPSSRATFRPRARQFQRVASGASMGRISVYSESDEEDQMPAPSQMPPASQRPRPRPVAKSKSTPIDVDSDDDLPRAKSGPNKRTNPGGAKPASTQKRRLTRTTSTGSVISEHETLQEAPVAGSSQDPIALQSSDAEGEMDDKTVKDTTPEQSRPNAVPASSNTSTREDSFSILQPADVEQPTPPTSQLQTSNFSSSDVFTQISQQCAAQPANPNDTWFHQGTRSHPPPAVHLETDHRGYAEQAAMPIDANFVMLAHQNPQFQGHYDSASSSTSYADQVATVRLENQSQRTPQASMSNSGRLWNQPDSGKRPDSPRHPGSTSRHASFPNLPPQEHPFGNTAQPPFAHQQATMSHTSGPGANVGHGTYTGMLESVDSSTYGAQSFPYGYGQQQYQHSQYQQVPQPQNHQHYHHRQIQQGHAAAAQHAHVAAPTSFPEAMNFARPVQGHSDPFFRRRLNGQAHTGQDGEGMMTIPSGSVAVGPSNLPQPAHSSQQHAQTSSFTQQMYTQQAYGHDQSWAHGRQGPHHF